jgi:hypothetical protein
MAAWYKQPSSYLIGIIRKYLSEKKKNKEDHWPVELVG